MSRRALATALLATTLPLGCGGEPAAPAEPPAAAPPATPVPFAAARPNVLLLIWDSTRADRLSLYGHQNPTTPNIDRVARDAAVFTQANASAFCTVPSVASILSGMFPHNHKVDWAPQQTKDGYSLELSGDIVTFAETMKELGYRTALFTASKVVADNKSFAQGFDEGGFTGEAVMVERALQFIDEPSEKPWFAVVYLLSPHGPYTPEPEFDLFTSKEVAQVNIGGCNKEEAGGEGFVSACDLTSGKATLTEAQWTHVRGLYDGEIRRSDDHFGELWAGIEKRGLADSSLFVFTSDHGEAFDDHERERAWHTHPYENNQIVPLVVRYPGRVPAKRIGTAVRTIDIYPTVVELVGGTPPEKINGRPLSETWTGAAANRENVSQNHGGLQWYRDGDYKLIYVRRPGAEYARLELYDLKADPLEKTNLAERDPATVERLKAKMNAFLDATRLDVTAGGGVSAEQLESLRAMGYVTE